MGRRIREARRSAGFSQAQLAACAQITAAAVSNYEQGARLPPIDTATAIGRALGVTPAELLGVDERSVLADDERELLRLYRKADERGRRTIQAVAAAQGDSEA